MIGARRGVGSLACALAAFVVNASAQAAQPAWRVDPTFGTGGIQTLEYGNLGRVGVVSVFLQGNQGLYWTLGLNATKNGKSKRRLVVRLNDDGTPGALTGGQSFAASELDPLSALGHDDAGDLFDVSADATIRRYDPMTLVRDPAYQVPLARAGNDDCLARDVITAVGVDPPGRLYVATAHVDPGAGSKTDCVNRQIFSQTVVTRYTPTGEPDPAFGFGGSAAVAGTSHYPLLAFAFAAGGRVYATFGGGVRAFTESGLPDAGFGTGGVAAIPAAQFLYPLFALPNGALDVGSVALFDPAPLIQLSPSGAILHQRQDSPPSSVLGPIGNPTVLSDSSVHFAAQTSGDTKSNVFGLAGQIDEGLQTTTALVALGNFSPDVDHPRSAAPWVGGAGMTPLRNGDLLAAVSPRTGELRWTRLTQRPVHAGHAPAGTPQPVVRSLEWVKDATEENDQLGKLHHVAARATYSCSKPSGCPMASASWTLVPTGHGHAVSSGAPQPVFPGPLWMPDDATTKTHCHHIAAGRYRLRLAVEDIYGRHASTQRAVRLARPAAVGECGQTIPFPTIGGGTGR